VRLELEQLQRPVRKDVDVHVAEVCVDVQVRVGLQQRLGDGGDARVAIGRALHVQ